MPIPEGYVFESYPFCTLDDVKREIKSIQLPLQMKPNASNLEEVFGQKLDLAREYIGQKIDHKLPQIFVSTVGRPVSWDQWLLDVGYTIEDLDSMKDTFTNPKVLRLSFSAYIILSMLRDGLFTDRMNHETNNELLKDLIDDWKEIFCERFSLACDLLKLDLDKDGRSTDVERPNQYRNRIDRV